MVKHKLRERWNHKDSKGIYNEISKTQDRRSKQITHFFQGL